MFKPTISMKSLTLGLFAALTLSLTSCDKEEKEPEIPDFSKEIPAAKPLEPITPSTPAPVTTTPASVSVPAAVSATATALASGQVTEEVTKAAEAMGKAISPDKANELATAFTPAVISTLLEGGNIPAALKTTLDGLKGNAALAAYVPSVTLPSVNGVTVTAIVPENNANVEAIEAFDARKYRLADIQSECTDQVTAAYNNAKKPLDDSRTQQEASINSAFDAAKGAVNTAECKSTIENQYKTQADAAKAIYDASVAGLESIFKAAKMDTVNYQLLQAQTSFTLYTATDAYKTAKDASIKACDAEGTAKIAAIDAAKKGDLDRIKAAYEASLAPVKSAMENSMKYCHDQGMGGN